MAPTLQYLPRGVDSLVHTITYQQDSQCMSRSHLAQPTVARLAIGYLALFLVCHLW